LVVYFVTLAVNLRLEEAKARPATFVAYCLEYDIIENMLRVVLDTNVLIAARRNRTGASNALLRAVDEGKFAMLASVPLFFEYEAVLCRAEHLLASRLTQPQVMGFLNYLAGIINPVKLHYLWRPQLGDVADEMVLETAINGRANCIVTFNTRHFEPATRFGIDVIRPDEAMRRIL
jgi:putative PIN family toxin of toxin-antitoxin system